MKFGDKVKVIETGVVTKITHITNDYNSSDLVYLTDWDKDVWFREDELELIKGS